METSPAIFAPVPTEAEFNRLSKLERLANFPPAKARQLRNTERAFITWKTTGDDRPLYTALSKHVRSCAWRYHHDKLYAVEREELEQILWAAVAACISKHDVRGKWFLLESVLLRLDEEAKDELKRINSAKRKLNYFRLTVPFNNDVHAPNHWESPETAYLRKEFIEAIYAPLSPKQKQAVALWSEGYTFKEIGHRLSISAQSAHGLIDRAMPHMKQVAREYAEVLCP